MNMSYMHAYIHVSKAKTGCSLVAADLNQKASLAPAFKGCHGAFLVTNFWEIFDVEKEVQFAPDKEEKHNIMSTNSLLNFTPRRYSIIAFSRHPILSPKH